MGADDGKHPSDLKTKNEIIISFHKRHKLMHQTLQNIKKRLVDARQHRYKGSMTAFLLGVGLYVETLMKAILISRNYDFVQNEIEVIDLIDEGYIFYNKQLEYNISSHVKQFGPMYCAHSNKRKDCYNQYDDEGIIMKTKIVNKEN